MFELLNVYNVESLSTKVEYNGQKVIFDISTLISKRNKEELDQPNQYALLNSYLDYKGDEFKTKLMNHYLEAQDGLEMILLRPNLRPLPVELVHNIIDMFNLDELFIYCKNIYGVQPPSALKDTFDKQVEVDGDGTRAQTYLKDDFIKLAALTIVLKSVLPIITQFGYFKKSHIVGQRTDHILFNFIKSSWLYKSEAMTKLYDFIEVLVNISFKKEDLAAIRIIEKGIDRDEMPVFILSSVIFNKISTATIINDHIGKNVITRIHNYVTNKLNVRKDVSAAIRPKQALSDVDSDNGDKESFLESYRSSTDLDKGKVVEFNWITETIPMILSQIDLPVNVNTIREIHKSLGIFLSIPIAKEQVTIISFIFKSMIDPRAIQYLKPDRLINLLAIGFSILWEMDSKYLAILLTSYKDIDDSGAMSINTTVNRTRLTKTHKELLMKYYPYTRVVNANDNENVAEVVLNNLANTIHTNSYTPTVNDKYILEVVENKADITMIPSNLKLLLTDMVIKLEQHIERMKNVTTNG